MHVGHQRQPLPLSVPSLPLLQELAGGEPGMGAPTSIGPRSPLGSHVLNLGSLLQAT